MAKRKYFGTDGIRGRANEGNMTPDVMMRLARAAGHVLKQTNVGMRPSVVIGKDTRLSGYMIESALQAGFTSAGFYCLLVGPMPTPAVAMLTRSLRANMGVMISASHNPFDDNGVKIFGADGFKLPDEVEAQIEHLMDNPDLVPLAEAEQIGRAVRIEDAAGRYIEFCKNAVPRDFTLDGIKVVVDCAHGATYKIAPRIFWEMGAEVVRIGASPDGVNINAECGSTHPQSLQAAVKRYGAHLGIALDGDGDRVILCDETGQIIDGDQIMAAIADHWHLAGILNGNTIAATQMSNMGLERFLQSKGITMLRTNVGDRYVMEAMRTNGLNFGGEQSGHLIFADHATTGDGIIGALQFLLVMRERSLKASQLARTFAPFPQVLKNVRLTGEPADAILAKAPVASTIRESEQALEGQGRVLIRKSGTEPLIRVMVEAAEPVLLETHLNKIVSVIEANL